MSSPMGQGGRALVLRLVLAEVLARRGEGPLAPRFALRPPAARVRPEQAASTHGSKERA